MFHQLSYCTEWLQGKPPLLNSRKPSFEKLFKETTIIIQGASMNKQSLFLMTPKPLSGNSPFPTIQDGEMTVMKMSKVKVNQLT